MSREDEVLASYKENYQSLIDQGINPYPADSQKDYPNQTVIDDFDQLAGRSIYLSGRVVSKRGHGKLNFIDLEDQSGKIQLFCSASEVESDSWSILELINVGDFTEAYGEVFQTQKGQISLKLKRLRILTKALRPLPSEHYGIKDEELRYRLRYLDLMRPEIRKRFYQKAQFWRSIREFLDNRGFIEVQTPVLETVAGGASATPFVTHYDALDEDVYLRISAGELWQKKLMVAGFERTYEIGRIFRNEGMSREHLQDYTQLEYYQAYADEEQGMELVRELYIKIAKDTFGRTDFEVYGHRFDLADPWERIDYLEKIRQDTDLDILSCEVREIEAWLKAKRVAIEPGLARETLIDIVWKQVRKEISGPVFLIGHPEAVSPLAKSNQHRPGTVRRFQVILAGSELGNGYSELNDPIDQEQRFIKQSELREGGDNEAQMHDKDFVRALEYGMPPTCGFGMSERLFSFLSNISIREATLFPIVKIKEDNGQGI